MPYVLHKGDDVDENVDMQIRELRPADHPALADLIHEWKPTVARDLEYKGFSRDLRNLVLTEQDRLVGWIQGCHNSKLWEQFHFRPDPPEGPYCSFVTYLYVCRLQREGGLGKALLAEFEIEAAQNGNDFICLDPSAGAYERPVHGFYRKQHYFEAGHQAGSHKHLMGKHLGWA
ncbi:acetyltransferase (GNAT) family protein [Arthrobacter sp. SLBN-83]|nr:acetyltransferase (GNAT) family protein [Arthrobacter sp. SLBN-83]